MRHSLESLVFMATVQQVEECVLWLAELKSTTHVQLKFRTAYGGSATSYNSINKWDRSSNKTGITVSHKSPRRPRTSKKDGLRFREACVCSSCKLIRIARSNVHLPTPHFMKFYTNFNVPMNYSSCSTSNQPTMTVERDSMRKCCRRLTVMRLSWTMWSSD
jgi:hypothetical protein